MSAITRRFILMVALPACAHAAAQDLPELYLYPEADRSIWVELDLPRTPENPDAVSQALGTLMSEEEPEEIEAFYDGPYESDTESEDVDAGAGWSGYWIDALPQHHVRISGALDLEPLRAILMDLGYRELRVSTYPPATLLSAVTWSEPQLKDDTVWDEYTSVVSLDAPLPQPMITYGHNGLTILLRAFPVLLCLAIPIAYLLLVRRRALRRPAAETGAACYACTRAYFSAMSWFWVAWIGVFLLCDPFAPLEYLSEPIQYAAQRAQQLPLFVLGALVTIGMRLIFAPVYKRYQESSWTRRGLLIQTLWMCGLLGVLLLFPGEILRQINVSPFHATTLLCVALLLGTACALGTIRSFGLVLQSLDEGELRERIDALSTAAGVGRLKGLYLIYVTRSPMLNAFASNKTQIMLTEPLLQHLTTRETDAIVAHELTHLRLNHPVRLMRLKMLVLLAGAVGGVALAIAFFSATGYMLPQWWPVNFTYYVCIIAAFGVGHLLILRRSRRFEREADAGAIELTGDAEAMIAGLAKITRMNHMPMRWGGSWREGMVTHPSTQRRAEQIAHRSQIAPERLTALLTGESVGDTRYTIPASAAHHVTANGAAPEDPGSTQSVRGRIFATQFKQRILQWNAIGLMWIPLVVSTGLAWTWTQVPLPVWPALVLSSALVLLSMVLFMNVAALAGFRGLARQLRARYETELDTDNARFVALCPNAGMQLYDGFTNWDVGFLNFDDTALHYWGDATAFTLSKSAIVEVSVFQQALSWIPQRRIRITWKEDGHDGAVHHYVISQADSGTLFRRNRDNDRLVAALKAWHADRDTEVPNPSAGNGTPTPLRIQGLPISEAIGFQHVLRSGILSGLFGFLIAVATGLPARSPLHTSAAGVALVASTAAILYAMPLWRYARKHRMNPST